MGHESLDPIDEPMGRVRVVLYEAYEHRRRLRGFLPLLPPLPELFRQRSARFHCRFAYAGTGCTAGAVEAMGSILAVAVIAAAITVGAAFARPTPDLNATFVGARSAHPTAAPAAPPSDRSPSGRSSNEVPVGPPGSSFETEVSTSYLALNAPAGVEGTTEIKRGIAIGLSKKWVIHVGDRDIQITEGTLLWLDCESRGVVLTTACNAYDKAPPEAKDRRNPPEIGPPSDS